MSKDDDQFSMEPMKMWREWVQKSEQQWSEALTGAMADEKTSKMFGHYFQEWLHAQNMFTEMVGQHLASMNLPSRVDVIEVKDRLGQVDDTLTILITEIHQLKKQLSEVSDNKNPGAASKKPRRTRKPPAKPDTNTTA